MPASADPTAPKERLWYLLLGLLFICAFWLRWPLPEPGWIHIDERVFLLNPLKMWSGDFNPHFFIYPTLHIYLTSILYYIYYLAIHSSPLEHFVAYQYFVDGSALIEVGRHFNSVLSATTAAVVALVGRRLYGPAAGVLAGLFFAALPLSVRFAHLATTDSPAVLWISCALFFSVRVAEDGCLRDCIWAGVCVGLAGGTKYPAALAGVPVAVACLLYWPTVRQRGVWMAGVAAIVVFALVSPYVLLDAKSAWEDLALMGRIHLGSEEAKADMPSWRYYLQYGLRYGIGIVGLVGLAGGVLWRPLVRRREEWVIVSAFAVFFLLLLMAESMFMRYALPLAPMVALLWVRPLVPWRRVATPLLALSLVAEPLYASWQTRALLAGDDTREQVERRLAQEAPDGAWLVHLPSFIGNIRVFDVGMVYSHERRFMLNYNRHQLIQAYEILSQHRDLPPLQITLQPESLQPQRPAEQEGGRVYVLWYQHPAIPSVDGDVATALLKRCDWVGDYQGSGDGAVYEAVDWYFSPIGGFAAVERTGPRIRVGQVPVAGKVHGLDAANFFGILHDILLGADKVRAGDWQSAVDLYEAIEQTPIPLHRILSTNYYYTYLFNYGVAADKLGRTELADYKWRLALEFKDDSPVLHQNMGVAYARKGHLAEARGHLERALELDADYAEAHFNLGNLLYQEDELDGAFAAFASAIGADPKLTGAWQGLGNVHFNRGQWPEALAAYRQALTLDPTLASVAYNMAKVHLQTAAPDSAIAVLHLALAVAPEDVEALYLLGDLYRYQGQIREARTHYARALELAPEDQRATAVRQYLERDL